MTRTPDQHDADAINSIAEQMAELNQSIAEL
jgi:hypothetical protein